MVLPTRVKEPLYAIVRIDGFLPPGATVEARITVKGIVTTLDEAEREVGRLNQLVASREVTYIWQTTRWLSAQPDTPQEA